MRRSTASSATSKPEQRAPGPHGPPHRAAPSLLGRPLVGAAGGQGMHARAAIALVSVLLLSQLALLPSSALPQGPQGVPTVGASDAADASAQGRATFSLTHSTLADWASGTSVNLWPTPLGDGALALDNWLPLGPPPPRDGAVSSMGELPSGTIIGATMGQGELFAIDPQTLGYRALLGGNTAVAGQCCITGLAL